LKQSHNHVMTGSIDAFFYKTLAGIRLDETHPGFEKVIIKPFIPDNLSHVYASIKTTKGALASGWDKKDSHLTLNITIPVNSKADVYIPMTNDSQIFEGGLPINNVEGITHLRSENGRQIYSVVSGDYQFIVK